MEIKIIPSKRGSVKYETLVKQIKDYLKVKPSSKNEGYKNRS